VTRGLKGGNDGVWIFAERSVPGSTDSREMMGMRIIAQEKSR
jgi:hypothetical protein